MAIFVMLNNLFHDFSVALLVACLLVLRVVHGAFRDDASPLERAFLTTLYGRLKKVVIGCWVVIILAGAVRTLAFQQFEWMEAAGRGQITALVLKHVLLVSLVAWGSVLQVRLSRRLRKQPA